MTPQEAKHILKKLDCPHEVINHSEAVVKLALKLAKRCLKNGVTLNLNLIEIGGLLHDIGRSFTHDVQHGVIGANFARTFKLAPSIINIIERHVGVGIPRAEAELIGLPSRDYLPTSAEEKLICYADKFIKDSMVMSLGETVKDLENSLGKEHPALNRFKKLHREVTYMMGVESNFNCSDL